MNVRDMAAGSGTMADGGQGLATAEELERDHHAIWRWAAAFGEEGPTASVHSSTGRSVVTLM